MIRLRGVIKRFTVGTGEVVALRGVDLDVEQRELVVVVGKSGSGKSTLLNLIGGIDRPTSGSVVVEGTRLDGLGEAAMARWRGATVGFVFQFFQLIPTLTAVENVMLPMDFAGSTPVRLRRDRAIELLERVGVAARATRLPAELSGGEQQRVAIARALANAPKVLLADEPTGNLDSETAAQVVALLRSLTAAGTTVVVVTHDQDLAEAADRVVGIADGQLVAPGARTRRHATVTA